MFKFSIVVDCARKVCEIYKFVRLGRKNQRSVYLNNKVKAVVKRKEAVERKKTIEKNAWKYIKILKKG